MLIFNILLQLLAHPCSTKQNKARNLEGKQKATFTLHSDNIHLISIISYHRKGKKSDDHHRQYSSHKKWPITHISRVALEFGGMHNQQPQLI